MRFRTDLLVPDTELVAQVVVASVLSPDAPTPLDEPLMTIRHLIAPIFILIVLAFPGMAQASADDVLRDCAEDGTVDGKYSKQEKRAALRKMPGEMKEYTDCEQEIKASIAGAKAKSSGNGGGSDGSGFGGSGASGGRVDPDINGDGTITPPERAEATKRNRALAQADTEKQLGDRATEPKDASAFNNASTSNGLSLPAVLALIALGLLAIGGGLYLLWRRNPELLRRVPIPFRGR